MFRIRVRILQNIYNVFVFVEAPQSRGSTFRTRVISPCACTHFRVWQWCDISIFSMSGPAATRTWYSCYARCAYNTDTIFWSDSGTLARRIYCVSCCRIDVELHPDCWENGRSSAARNAVQENNIMLSAFVINIIFIIGPSNMCPAYAAFGAPAAWVGALCVWNELWS